MLLALPAELRLLVLKKLDLRSLLAVAQVNIELYRVIQNILICLKNPFALNYFLPKEVRHKHNKHLFSDIKAFNSAAMIQFLSFLNQARINLMSDPDPRLHYLKTDVEILIDLFSQTAQDASQFEIDNPDNVKMHNAKMQIDFWAHYIFPQTYYNHLQYITWQLINSINPDALYKIYLDHLPQFSDTQALSLFFTIAPKLSLENAKKIAMRFIPIDAPEEFTSPFEEVANINELLMMLRYVRIQSSPLLAQEINSLTYYAPAEEINITVSVINAIGKLYQERNGIPYWMLRPYIWKISKHLLQAGVDIYTPTISGLTGLDVVSLWGEKELVQEFIQAGAILDIKSTICEGKTPIMNAVFYAHADVVAELIAAGASLDLIDANEMRAADYCTSEDINLINARIRHISNYNRASLAHDLQAVRSMVINAVALDDCGRNSKESTKLFNEIDFTTFSDKTDKQLLYAKSLAKRILNKFSPKSIQGLEELTDTQQVKNYLSQKLPSAESLPPTPASAIEFSPSP